MKRLLLLVTMTAILCAERPHGNRDLYMALRTRILTNAEMAKVLELGDELLEDPCIDYVNGKYVPLAGCSSNPELNAKLFNEAVLQQFRLRLASKTCKGETK